MFIDAKLADLAAFEMDGCFQDADEEFCKQRKQKSSLCIGWTEHSREWAIHPFCLQDIH